MARSGPESWSMDGKEYAISGTYYLALHEGLQFTIDYPAPVDPAALTDASAYDLAFPLMRHAFEKRLYERSQITKIGSGNTSVSRIGVSIIPQTAGGMGYNVGRSLDEIRERIGGEAASTAPTTSAR